MKTNKEQIYDIVQVRASARVGGVSTQYIADALGIQRSNASRLLNELAEEGRVEKRNGRPVLYCAGEKDAGGYECFDNLAGKDGSLRRALRLIQAAVLYPGRPLGVHITGARGTGRSLMAYVAHSFAVESGTLSGDLPCRTVDCGAFAGDEARAEQELFGEESAALIADNAHLLSPRLRSRLCEVSEAQTRPLLIAITDPAGPAASEFHGRFPITVELPTLDERPLDERMELARRFMNLEAARAKKTVAVSSEVMRCLLLYDCAEYNVMQLKGDIKTACASAYVRNFSAGEDHIEVFMGDFEPYVRKGFLNYRRRRDDVERLVEPACRYSFGASDMVMSPVERDKLLYSDNFYEDMEKRAVELRAHGLQEKDVVSMLGAELEASFNAYRTALARKAVNREQLSRLVDRRVIELVGEFLDEAAQRFGKAYPTSVYYGLCLHIDSALRADLQEHRLTASQINAILGRYKDEYLFSLQFAARLEAKFGVKLPMDEVVLITMFLCMDSLPGDSAARPAVIYAFHGEGIATALAATVENMTRLGNTFGVDIRYEQDEKLTYEDLRECLMRADTGAGAVVLYDLEDVRQSLEALAAETGKEIRMVELPVAETSIRWARAAASGNLDELYGGILDALTLGGPARRRTIVTLCSTGEGGAEQIKRYIEKYGKIGECAVVPMAAADRDELREKLLELMKTSTVECIVGPWDPKLFSIPYIPLSAALSCPPEKLPSVLSFKAERKRELNWDEVYEYLGEQLEHIDMKKLRKALPPVVESINDTVGELTLDSEIGLFIHLACCINRLAGREPVQQNLHKDEIYAKYGRQFKEVIALLRPLEKAFGIIFSDDEVANVLTIINKL